MVYVKLTILLTVLGNLQRGHSDTTVASASTSYVNSSNEPTVDGSTVQYQTNWTTTDSNGGTTKPVTQNVMTTEASTPNPEALLRILGKGLKWFLENSTFEIFCSYSDASINVDPAQLRFYDGDNNQLLEDRGFRRTVLSSSSSFVNVSLTKDRIQAEDFGKYFCRYGNGSPFVAYVGILKVNITDATCNLLMENKEDYTLTCDVIPAVDTEIINSEVTLWFKDGVKAEDVSPRHIVNGSTLNIRKAEWSDIGPYTCEYIVLWGSHNSSFQWMVSFNGEARMGSVSVSFNYFQDDDLELSCPVSGYPYPVVTWQRNGVVITPDNRITLSPDASGKYTNAVLNIQSLQFEDKGDYSCTGSSELNTVTSSPIKIRVKVKCGPGNFFNSSTLVCEDCPVGTYQDQDDQTSCTPCPQGSTTQTVASPNSSDCKAGSPSTNEQSEVIDDGSITVYYIIGFSCAGTIIILLVIIVCILVRRQLKLVKEMHSSHYVKTTDSSTLQQIDANDGTQYQELEENHYHYLTPGYENSNLYPRGLNQLH